MSNTVRLAPVAALVASLAGLVPPGAVRAQIGHAPERSPYRDLPVSHALILGGGYMNGSGGRVGVGPSKGPIAGLRYTIHLGGPVEAMLGFSAADLQRVVFEQGAVVDTARQSVFIGDLGFGFLLTGRKTWHRLAPYIGFTAGAAFGGSVPEDISGYQFETKFQFGPMVGIRWYPSSRVSLRIEGRDILWRLGEYPLSFPLAPEDPDREWAHNPTLTFALGWRIRS